MRPEEREALIRIVEGLRAGLITNEAAIDQLVMLTRAADDSVDNSTLRVTQSTPGTPVAGGTAEPPPRTSASTGFLPNPPTGGVNNATFNIPNNNNVINATYTIPTSDLSACPSSGGSSMVPGYYQPIPSPGDVYANIQNGYLSPAQPNRRCINPGGASNACANVAPRRHDPNDPFDSPRPPPTSNADSDSLTYSMINNRLNRLMAYQGNDEPCTPTQRPLWQWSPASSTPTSRSCTIPTGRSRSQPPSNSSNNCDPNQYPGFDSMTINESERIRAETGPVRPQSTPILQNLVPGSGTPGGTPSYLRPRPAARTPQGENFDFGIMRRLNFSELQDPNTTYSIPGRQNPNLTCSIPGRPNPNATFNISGRQNPNASPLYGPIRNPNPDATYILDRTPMNNGTEMFIPTWPSTYRPPPRRPTPSNVSKDYYIQYGEANWAISPSAGLSSIPGGEGEVYYPTPNGSRFYEEVPVQSTRNQSAINDFRVPFSWRGSPEVPSTSPSSRFSVENAPNRVTGRVRRPGQGPPGYIPPPDFSYNYIEPDYSMSTACSPPQPPTGQAVNPNATFDVPCQPPNGAANANVTFDVPCQPPGQAPNPNDPPRPPPTSNADSSSVTYSMINNRLNRLMAYRGNDEPCTPIQRPLWQWSPASSTPTSANPNATFDVNPNATFNVPAGQGGAPNETLELQPGDATYDIDMTPFFNVIPGDRNAINAPVRAEGSNLREVAPDQQLNCNRPGAFPGVKAKDRGMFFNRDLQIVRPTPAPNANVTKPDTLPRGLWGFESSEEWGENTLPHDPYMPTPGKRIDLDQPVNSTMNSTPPVSAFTIERAQRPRWATNLPFQQRHMRRLDFYDCIGKDQYGNKLPDESQDPTPEPEVPRGGRAGSNTQARCPPSQGNLAPGSGTPCGPPTYLRAQPARSPQPADFDRRVIRRLNFSDLQDSTPGCENPNLTYSIPGRPNPNATFNISGRQNPNASPLYGPIRNPNPDATYTLDRTPMNNGTEMFIPTWPSTYRPPPRRPTPSNVSKDYYYQVGEANWAISPSAGLSSILGGEGEVYYPTPNGSRFYEEVPAQSTRNQSAIDDFRVPFSWRGSPEVPSTSPSSRFSVENAPNRVTGRVRRPEQGPPGYIPPPDFSYNYIEPDYSMSTACSPPQSPTGQAVNPNATFDVPCQRPNGAANANVTFDVPCQPPGQAANPNDSPRPPPSNADSSSVTYSMINNRLNRLMAYRGNDEPCTPTQRPLWQWSPASSTPTAANVTFDVPCQPPGQAANPNATFDVNPNATFNVPVGQGGAPNETLELQPGDATYDIDMTPFFNVIPGDRNAINAPVRAEGSNLREVAPDQQLNCNRPGAFPGVKAKDRGMFFNRDLQIVRPTPAPNANVTKPDTLPRGLWGFESSEEWGENTLPHDPYMPTPGKRIDLDQPVNSTMNSTPPVSAFTIERAQRPRWATNLPFQQRHMRRLDFYDCIGKDQYGNPEEPSGLPTP